MESVIAIFDIGKTNKKFFLFDKQYHIVYEKVEATHEITDDDGDPCEDIDALSHWVLATLTTAVQENKFKICALNFSTYGASFVYVDAAGKVIAPLYNYLKTYPEQLQQAFNQKYGLAQQMALETASPTLGHLNSGMQMYWLKYQKPKLYEAVATALHLPQYMSYLITHQTSSELTSIGCHTQLWNFQTNQYHNWVKAEKIDALLPPIMPASHTVSVNVEGANMQVGTGLHDSSAALIPYLTAFSMPFILISTGTWCISLHPFNDSPLTTAELEKDCLFYMGYHGKPVKAARLFAGHEHELQTKKIATHFGVAPDFYKDVVYDNRLIDVRVFEKNEYENIAVGVHPSDFDKQDLHIFPNVETAYHVLIAALIVQQKASTSLVLGNTKVKRIFVDGGFGKNTIYMNMLALAFKDIEVYAASVAQATAVGAALAIHECWNPTSIPASMIDLKYYASI